MGAVSGLVASDSLDSLSGCISVSGFGSPRGCELVLLSFSYMQATVGETQSEDGCRVFHV